MDGFHLYTVDTEGSRDGNLQTVVSVLPQDHAFEKGLVGEAIVGVLLTPLGQGGKLEPDNFARNSAFVEFLHRFIARHAPSDPELRDAARRQGSGHLFILDARTPTLEGTVPPEDIIGAFEVENGEIVAASYQPNSRHLILSEAGFFKLSPQLMGLLRKELEALQKR